MTQQSSSMGLSVTADESTLTKSATAVLSIMDDGVVTAKIADGNVTTEKIESGGTFYLLAEETVTAGPVTTITFSGLDLTADYKYMIIANVKNGTATSNSLYLFCNGDTTTTNYYEQFTQANNTTISAQRNNYPSLGGLDTGTESTIWIMLSQINGEHPIGTMLIKSRDTSAIMFGFASYEWNNTANVTSLSFTHLGGNCISNGSTIRIYKVKP